METTSNCKDAVLPRPCLKLLVPPIRLMSAFMWQVAQQCNVMQYDKLAEFVSLASEMVPELLSSSQWAQLILGLRGRLVLELCRGEGPVNLKTIQSHLDNIHACTVDLNSRNQESSDDVLKTTYTNFANLVQNLLRGPFEKEYFFHEVFPVKYGPTYDRTLQQLVFEFLSRLEQLLPVPSFTQTAAWLGEAPSVANEFGQHLSNPSVLKTLFLHHRHLGTVSAGPPCNQKDTILSTLSLPPEITAEKYIDQYGEDSNYDDDDDDDDDKERLLKEDSEDDDSHQSSDVASDEWLPVKSSGQLSKLFICPQCAFAHQLKKVVQVHIQKEHKKKDPPKKKVCVRKGSDKGKTRHKIKDPPENKKQSKPKRDSGKKPEWKQEDTPEKERGRKKKDNSENKRERKRREPTGVDRRFLNTRTVIKSFTEEETRCPQCEKVFELPNQLKTHLKLHTLPYHCSQCERGFTSKSGYYQHQRLHKRGRTFVCSHCDSTFLCAYSLKQHERKHTEGPTHLCTVCGKSFSKAGMQRHMLMHKGEKNYLCTTCGKTFLSSGELILHTRSHTGETPYTCTHCGKGFSCKSHLIVHVRSHTGERPYPCKQCPKHFITLNCLKRHMLCHDGIKPFKCNDCGKDFSQLGNLKRHLTTHKPDAQGGGSLPSVS